MSTIIVSVRTNVSLGQLAATKSQGLEYNFGTFPSSINLTDKTAYALIIVVTIIIPYLYDYGSNPAKMLILSAGDDAVVPRVSRV